MTAKRKARVKPRCMRLARVEPPVLQKRRPVDMGSVHDTVLCRLREHIRGNTGQLYSSPYLLMLMDQIETDAVNDHLQQIAQGEEQEARCSQ